MVLEIGEMVVGMLFEFDECIVCVYDWLVVW